MVTMSARDLQQVAGRHGAPGTEGSICQDRGRQAEGLQGGPGRGQEGAARNPVPLPRRGGRGREEASQQLPGSSQGVSEAGWQGVV